MASDKFIWEDDDIEIVEEPEEETEEKTEEK